MTLSGHTEPYAVFGHPIGHSLSPIMHNASFNALGLDAIYLAFDVAPDKLMSVLPAMQDLGFRGVNLTVPLKEVAFKGLTDLDASAQRVGAVNTVQFLDDGTLRGHSTDGQGFLIDLQESLGLSSVADLTVFVLGAGGAGRTLALTCADQGAKAVNLADLDGERAQRLQEEITSSTPCLSESIDDKSQWADCARQADLVIQSTPVGMKPDEASLLDASAFRDSQVIYDLVYMYPETAFMKTAKAAGAKAANGLGMLLHQGAHAFTIWTDKQADINAMRNALQEAVYKSKTT